MTFQNRFASIPAPPARSISSEQERENHLSPSPISRRYSSHFSSRPKSSPPGSRLSCRPNTVLGFDLSAVAGFWSWDSEKARMVFRRRPRDDLELNERLGLSSAKSPAKPEITTKCLSMAFAERESLHESLWDSTGTPRRNAPLAQEHQPAPLEDQSSPPSSPPPLRFNTNFQFSDWILPGGIDTSIPCDEDFADWPDLSNLSANFLDPDPNTSTISTDSDFLSPPTPVHGVGLGFGFGLAISNGYLKPKSFCHDGVVSDTFLDEALLTFSTMESAAVNGTSEPTVVKVPGRCDEARAGERRTPDHEEDAKLISSSLARVAASLSGQGLGHDEIEDRDSTPKLAPVHVSTARANQVISNCSRQLPSRQVSNFSSSVSPSVHRKNRLRNDLHKSNYDKAIDSTSRYTSSGTLKSKPKDSGNETLPRRTVLSTSIPTSELQIRRTTSLPQRARPQAEVRRDVTTSTISSSFKSTKPLSSSGSSVSKNHPSSSKNSSIRFSSTLQRSTEISGTSTSSFRGVGVVQRQQAGAYAAKKSSMSVERCETHAQNHVEGRGSGGRRWGSSDVQGRLNLERTSWR